MADWFNIINDTVGPHPQRIELVRKSGQTYTHAWSKTPKLHLVSLTILIGYFESNRYFNSSHEAGQVKAKLSHQSFQAIVKSSCDLN